MIRIMRTRDVAERFGVGVNVVKAWVADEAVPLRGTLLHTHLRIFTEAEVQQFETWAQSDEGQVLLKAGARPRRAHPDVRPGRVRRE